MGPKLPEPIHLAGAGAECCKILARRSTSWLAEKPAYSPLPDSNAALEQHPRKRSSLSHCPCMASACRDTLHCTKGHPCKTSVSVSAAGRQAPLPEPCEQNLTRHIHTHAQTHTHTHTHTHTRWTG